MPKKTYYIPKMDCLTEEDLIKSRLSSLPHVQNLEFNLIEQIVTVTHDLPNESKIEEALLSLGMDFQVKTSDDLLTQREKIFKPSISRFEWLIVLISGVLAFGAEAFAYISGTEKLTIVFILSLASILVGGRQTFMKGVKAVRFLNLNMNFLMAVAITGAFLIGEWPEAAMVTFLFTLAEMIEVYSLDKARHAIRGLMEMSPDVATVFEKSQWVVKPISEIKLNDIIWVKPGERLPLDGMIVKGQTSINQAPITGESMPIEKKMGDTVYAGTINERGSFEFRVTVTPGDTVLAKIITALQKAQSERAPTQRFVDQFAKYYTPLMVILAILLATIPPLFFAAPFYPWFYKALVLLVIACPCALVISTPVTLVSGLTAAAKHGILIKGGTYLEAGHQLKAIALDKTGTLTNGKPVVVDILPLASHQEKNVLQLAASLDAHSEHPVANAIVQEWAKSNGHNSLLPVDQFEAAPGRGVTGLINNVRYFIGNHRYAEEKGVCDANIEGALKSQEEKGRTTIILSTEKQAIAILSVADTIRETSVAAIKAMHDLGLTTAMITGDNATTAHAIAKMVGIDDIRANLLPADKLTAMDALLKKYNTVGMVGDGINDAPALAKATIGFAMGNTGTDTALEAADVALMEDNLMKIPLFIRLSRKTWRKLVENITLSIGTKAIFFVLALFGYATLWMAIFADMGASLIVVFNGLRLLRFKE